MMNFKKRKIKNTLTCLTIRINMNLKLWRTLKKTKTNSMKKLKKLKDLIAISPSNFWIRLRVHFQERDQSLDFLLDQNNSSKNLPSILSLMHKKFHLRICLIEMRELIVRLLLSLVILDIILLFNVLEAIWNIMLS